MKTFEARTVIPATMPQVIAFHQDPRAIKWLSPPPLIMTVQRDTRTSLSAGEIDFTLWFGLLPVHWTARHEPGPIDNSFRDRMLRGPMKFWLHEHSFRQVENEVELIDHVTYELPNSGFWALFTRLFFDGLPLRFLFFYRHLRTRQLAATYQAAQPV
jgi:ligand-binding SRPBCC domain-containing protein